MNQFYTSDMEEASSLMLEKNGKMFEISKRELSIIKHPEGGGICLRKDENISFLVEWKD